MKLPPTPPPSLATATMRANRSRDTGPELRLRRALHAAGHRFRVNIVLDAPGRRVRPDLVFTRQRLAIFVDGCYWHRCPEHGRMPTDPSGYWSSKFQRNVDRDRAVGEALRADGWRVLRIWEHVPVGEAVTEVEDALRVVSAPDADPGNDAGSGAGNGADSAGGA
jgi:DNA mismatch endonuclease (patch repair protein)